MSQEKLNHSKEGKKISSNEKKKVDEKKKAAAKGVMSWLKDNWKKSSILLGAGAISTASMGQTKSAEKVLVDPQHPDKVYVLDNGKVWEKKIKKGGKLEKKIYKGEAVDYGVSEEEVKDNTANYEDGFKTQMPYDSNFHKPAPSHLGDVSGSGESFRAEIPYKDGIRLFKGVEGERDYNQFISNFKKSGGVIKSEKKEINYQENDNQPKDGSFYKEIKTREGTRVFKGEEGRKEFQKWEENMKRATQQRR